MPLPIIAFLAFKAINVALWALPLTPVAVFLTAVPLGIVYFWGVFRLYRGAEPRQSRHAQNVPG